MTNHEHYKKDINKLSAAMIHWGFGDGGIKRCNAMNCAECKFVVEPSCESAKLKWMDKEYKTPETDWSAVETGTSIYVSMDNKNWLTRRFAFYYDGKVYAFEKHNTERVIHWLFAKL